MNNTKKEITIKPRFALPVFMSWAMVPYVLLLVVFIIDALDGEIDDGYLQTGFYLISFVLTTILAGIVLPFRKAILRNISYVFHKEKIVLNRKYPFQSSEEVHYNDIQDIAIKQNYIQKLYNIGSLSLKCRNNTSYTLYSLDKVVEVKQLIDTICYKIKE